MVIFYFIILTVLINLNILILYNKQLIEEYTSGIWSRIKRKIFINNHKNKQR